jgi:hypothetical protein
VPGGLFDKGAPPRPFLWGAFESGFRPGEDVEWTDADGEIREGRYRAMVTAPSQVRRKRSTVYVETPEPHLVTVHDRDLRRKEALPL